MKQAELFNVKDHVAIVTGAASGLGLAYAEVMAENGAMVVMADINQAELDRHVGAAACGWGARSRPAVCSMLPIPTRCARQSTARRSGINGSTCCSPMPASAAGRARWSIPAGAIDQFDVEAYKRAIDINLTATLMAMRFAVPHMKQRRSGSIVATASIAGIRAEPITGYGYIASKAAVINIVRQAAVELAPYNIRVNAIAPGPFSHQYRRRPAASRSGDRETVCRHGAARTAGEDRRDQGAGAAAGVARRQLSHRHGHSDRRRRHGGDDARQLFDRRAARWRERLSPRSIAKSGNDDQGQARRRIGRPKFPSAGASSSR